MDEALCEFEKLYIKKALARHKQHLSKTAVVLGIHRNTLAKRVATYKTQESPQKGTKVTNLKKRRIPLINLRFCAYSRGLIG